MMLTKRLLPGVLLACCFGALACSDEKVTPKTMIDAGEDEPEDEEFEDDEEDEEPTARRPKDAGLRRDGGPDAGRPRDAGPDASRVTSMDSGTADDEEDAGDDEPGNNSAGGSSSNGSGGNSTPAPTVVDTERQDAGVAGRGDGTLVDADNNPAHRASECSPAVLTRPGSTLTLDGCCLKSGSCGGVSLQPPNVCAEYSMIENWPNTPEGRGWMAAVPAAKSCTYNPPG